MLVVEQLVFQMIAAITAPITTIMTAHSIRIHQRLSEDESLEVAVVIVAELEAAVATIERPALAAAVLKFSLSDVLPVLDDRSSATACAAAVVSNVI